MRFIRWVLGLLLTAGTLELVVVYTMVAWKYGRRWMRSERVFQESLEIRR